MSPKTITCPDCGLDLRVLPDATGSQLVYSVNDWQRRCRRLNLGGPALCLVRREGPKADNGSKQCK
jgi:hypothetical protein